MSEIEDLVGEWAYDASNDESFLIVAPWTVGEGVAGFISMYADGVAWDDLIDTADLTGEQQHMLDVSGEEIEETGGRYSVITGAFPSLEVSREMCADGHTFNTSYDNLYEGESYKGALRERHVRCARCAFSYGLLLEHGADNPNLDTWKDGKTTREHQEGSA